MGGLSAGVLSISGAVPMGNSTLADGFGGLFWMTSGLCPWGHQPAAIPPLTRLRYVIII
jgi:hypothetical protein